ncbi:MAG: ATP-dependent helicase [Actinobacteria bacterium]|nr:MAG: ATP-dependent helicase [Actinomycetota bacterium]
MDASRSADTRAADGDDALAAMSPAAGAWFAGAFEAPTPAQIGAWKAIRSGDSALVIAPTGSGKTLAAFFSALDELSTRNTAQGRPAREQRTSVLYISPLKALAVDVQRNLRAPLAGLRQEAARLGGQPPDITVGLRTGDTPPDERRRLARTPPDILITTPESLFLLLTSAARESLRGVRTVIIDEIHAVAGTKRGAHLAVSLERLDALLPGPAARIGLSATVRPASEMARFLGGGRPVRIVAEPAQKELDISVIVPVEDLGELGPTLAAPDGSVAGAAAGSAGSIWPHVEERVADLIAEHHSTLVFVNSRRLAERLTSRLNEIAADRAAPAADATAPVIARAHHGSVSKEQRALIEEDLKAGRLPAVVATSSLELGIDMGEVDLVVQVESPPTIAAGLQRVGRAGHHVGAVSRGRIFPKYRADLLQAAVVASHMRERRIEHLRIGENPLDVLAQHVVAAAAMDDWQVDDLAALVRRAAPFQSLPESSWLAVLEMLAGAYPSDVFAELRPRLVWDRDRDVISGRPGAQRLAVTSGGTIPDRGLFAVYLAGGAGGRLGELDEEMVYESRVGDVFALGAASWRIEDITHDRVLVSPAPGVPGRMPFWHGDALGRGAELGRAMGAFVREVSALSPSEAVERLRGEGLDELAAANLTAYLSEQLAATGALPTDRALLLERFRDELGDWQVVLHSPFGAAVHAPWALAAAAALREQLGVDVAAFHSDDGIVLRIPDGEDDVVWDDVRAAVLVDPGEVDRIVTAEVGGSALFAARFRECAARSLLLPRRQPGKRAPLWQQRRRSAQLLAIAAEYPGFPVVLEAMRECLQDVYDLSALRELLTGVGNGSIALREVSTEQPSPFARSLLFGYVEAFMYEGDSPLAERRAQALALDSSLLAELLGTVELRELLDAEAMAAVAAEVGWRTAERPLRDVEDLADALRVLGPLADADLVLRGADPGWARALVAARRAIEVRIAGEQRFAAVEDAGRLRDALGTALPVGVPTAFTEPVSDPLGDLLARYARTHGPFTADEAAANLGIGRAVAEDTLERLSGTGRVVTGEFRPGGAGREWCDTEVLRRVRRRSIAALRREAEPVPQAQYASFLPRWQGVGGDARGADGLFAAIDRLAGCPVPLSALESLVLPSRVRDYSPAQLDSLTSAGDVIWTGAGGLPGGDGWVVFAPADAPELLPDALPLADSVSHPDLAAAVLGAVDVGGGWFHGQILANLSAAQPEGFTADALADTLLELLWAGWISNDTLEPVRRRLGRRPARRTGGPPQLTSPLTSPPAAGTRSRRPGAVRRGRVRPDSRTAARASLLPGRWSAVPRGSLDPTVRAAAGAEWLLARHAVLTRGALSMERYPGGFTTAYKVLSQMEESTGGCIRGYAIEGLGGAQFTTATAVDRLRAHQPGESAGAGTGLLLAAADPGQPYGAALPWPARAAAEASGHRPARKAGASVVLVSGRPVAYLERGGRSLLTWTDDPAELASAAGAFAEAVRARRLGAVSIQRVDGAGIADSAAGAALLQAGFVWTPRGMRLR